MTKATRRTAPPTRVDNRWFQACITASKHGSIHRLAPLLRNRQGRPMNHAGLWLMIHGRRKMTVEDARQLADLLEKPFAEVCRRAGVDVGDVGDTTGPRLRTATAMVSTLLAYIDEHGVRLPERIRDAAKRVIAGDG